MAASGFPAAPIRANTALLHRVESARNATVAQEDLSVSVFMRSLMFVPGHRQRMVDRGLGLGDFAPGPFDVVMLDLEDGVPIAEKVNARTVISASLRRPSNPNAASPLNTLRYVRINAFASEHRDHDLRAVVRPGLAGIVMPKVDDPEDAVALGELLDAMEPRVGLPNGSVRIIAAVESALGLINAYRTASASPRVIGLMFGAEDYALDLGLPAYRAGEASELMFARSSLVNACAAAQKFSFDGVWPDIQDIDGLKRDALQARRLGFTGKSMIHPGQAETINSTFSPSAEDIAYGRRVMKAYDEAQARGDGAVALGGQLLDLPIIKRARRTLDMAKALAPK
jgi:citrate lyase subunit beta/citryl-CoA lyase